MGWRENPVLQRELLVNLRMPRAFFLLAVYQAMLGGLVLAAWPQAESLDFAQSPASARRLSDLFFLGQFVLASLMAPSFASGAIAGEKERRTFEMLLAAPLTPEAIIWGKGIASLAHLLLLVFTSLPIVVLCLPLGGVSLYEVLAAYFAMLSGVVVFGMISLACSAAFRRTSASLVVSYLVILPLAALAIGIWWLLQDQGELRLRLIFTVLPAITIAAICLLFYGTAGRLHQPPDVGSEGKEVVDEEEENRRAVGLVIDRHRFPDRLFAPPRRNDLMADGTNPVYDKELHSEIFAQGTLMLRLVIQISMLLAIPMMSWTLFYSPELSYLYVGYVLLFACLVGPVFSAGSLSSERERQTLDLLLTTNITPWQILSGKLISGLRVSTVLTAFLTWPLVIATALVPAFWQNLAAVFAFFVTIAMTCVTASLIALTASALFRRTVHAMLAAYLAILVVYVVPPAGAAFCESFLPGIPVETWLRRVAVISPFTTAYDIPFASPDVPASEARWNWRDRGTAWLLGYSPLDWAAFAGHFAVTLALQGSTGLMLLKLFQTRWRVAEGA